MSVERQLKTARLIGERTLSSASQTKHLEFAVEGAEHFTYAPGQFLSLVATNPAGKSITRAYTLASGPYAGNRFDLCLNRVEGGFFSNLLCDLKLGDAVRFHGPYGSFTLREPFRDSLFLCEETGVAPMRGFLQQLAADSQSFAGRTLHMIYTTRLASDIFYREFFDGIAAQHNNVQYEVLVREDHASAMCERASALITAMDEEKRHALDVYICGFKEMIKAVRTLLTEQHGFDKKQILYERYD